MPKTRKFQWLLKVGVLVLLGAPVGLPPIAASPADAGVAGDVQVLASGPIHEAFAEAVGLDPEPGIEAPAKPPARIEEVPPSSKPEGDVQWIPGYWAWDEDRSDFIWVSGIWRVPPPGRYWVSGYWAPSTSGYRWISGYWAGADESRTAYLPAPPESVEVGPSSLAPSADHTWIPGGWVWVGARYAWRPGYWSLVHPDWIWVPAGYLWTPRGYLFVSGYWDYTVIHRGILYAPVYIPHRSYFRAAFAFSPGVVISLNIFDDALFLRPRHRHYYYGDYYARKHLQRGIYPWYSPQARRAVYDPIYAHQRWHHRYDRRWENRLEASFQTRRDRAASRPHPIAGPHDFRGGHGDRHFQPLSETARQNVPQRHRAERIQRLEPPRQRTPGPAAPPAKRAIRPRPQEDRFDRLRIPDHSLQNTVRSPKTSGPPVQMSRRSLPAPDASSRRPAVDRPSKRSDWRQTPPARRQNPDADRGMRLSEGKSSGSRPAGTILRNHARPQERASGNPRPMKQLRKARSDDEAARVSERRRSDNGRHPDSGRGPRHW